MATTAKITIVSSDLLSDALDLAASTTLFKSGASTDVEKTTGLARYSSGSTSYVKLLESGDYTGSKAHKLYIKHTSTTRTDFVELQLGTSGSTEVLGRLYGGEWALIPWSGDADFGVVQSATTSVLEWMLFYE